MSDASGQAIEIVLGSPSDGPMPTTFSDEDVAEIFGDDKDEEDS